MKHKEFVEGVLITPTNIIKNPAGDIFHGLKATENGFVGFGEAYFSTIKKNMIKGWKLHKKMTLNLLVPNGKIRFVIYDHRQDSPTFNLFQEIVLSKENYHRLTIPPDLWMAFQGLEYEENMLLNIASHSHDPNEVISKPINDISFAW